MKASAHRTGSKDASTSQVGRVARRDASTNTPTLQRSLGNQGVQLLLGAVDTPAEREADRVADTLMTGVAARVSYWGNGVLRRACAACATEQPAPCATCDSEVGVVQRSPAGHGLTEGAVPASVQSGIRALQGGGEPLPASLRTRFEDGLGRDLAGIRVHTGTSADTLARSLGARAFTVGDGLFFAAGQYRPGSLTGQRLIAHELAHVVQQSHGTRLVQRTACADAQRLHAERAGRSSEGARQEPAQQQGTSDARWAATGRGIDFALQILQNPAARAALNILPLPELPAASLRLFRTALPQIRRIWDLLSDPARLMRMMRQFVDEHLQGVEAQARARVSEAAFSALRGSRHMVAIGLGLGDAVAELLSNWTAPFVTAFHEFMHPFDVRAEMADLDCIQERLQSGQISTLEAFSAVYSWLIGWVNRYSVYVGFALVAGGALVGAVGGAAAGGAGAVPGAAAGAGTGWALSEEFGMGILAANAVDWLLQVTTAGSRLLLNDQATIEDQRQGRTPSEQELGERQRQDEEAYVQIAHVLLGLGIMGALVLLASFGPQFARVAVRRLTRRYPSLRAWIAQASQRLEQSAVGRVAREFERGQERIRPTRRTQSTREETPATRDSSASTSTVDQERPPSRATPEARTASSPAETTASHGSDTAAAGTTPQAVEATAPTTTPQPAQSTALVRYDPAFAAEQAGVPLRDPRVPRRSWQEFETAVHQEFPNAQRQPSYIEGDPVRYGADGSVRPDFLDGDAHFIEAKSYDLADPASRARLYRTVGEQARARLQNLPPGSRQSIYLDGRGFAIPRSYLERIPRNIEEATGGIIRAADVHFLF